MMERITIDTNIVIQAFRENQKAIDILNNRETFISIITVKELLSYPHLTDKEEQILQSFFVECIIVPNSPELQNIVISLRKKYKLKIPDAFIAATSTQHKLPLFSADTVFERISELNFIHVEF